MQKLSVTIKGKNKTWSFTFMGDPKHIPDWEADGLEVAVVLNEIPTWLPNWFPVKWWCFLQDVFYFKSPFKNL